KWLFVRIDISDTRYERLLEQPDLDRLGRPLQSAHEIVHVKVVPKRFRPQRLKPICVECQAPETARVLKNQNGLPERKHDSRVFGQRRGRGLQIQSARHSEMTEQRNGPALARTPQSKQQVFAAPRQIDKPRSAQDALERSEERRVGKEGRERRLACQGE